MSLQNFILYAASFIGLWYGSGLIVDSIKRLARKINVSSFAFSFFVLGFLTSIPEIGVGINALEQNQPEIFIGNLLGSVIVMFLLVIPLLAVLGNGVRVKKHLSNRDLLVTLGIIAVPALFALDQTVTNVEGFILMGLYVVLFYIIRAKKGVLERVERMLQREQKNWRQSTVLRLAFGVLIVFMTSRFIVEQTILAAEVYQLSTFIISLLVLSIGTNLPEISLALRSLTSKAEDVALGDYLGSAATNTMLFGVFTLVNNGEVITERSFTVTFYIIVGSLLAFFLLTRGKSWLTRKEGWMLLGCYVIFLVYEANSLLSAAG